jgi:hypothetical protein
VREQVAQRDRAGILGRTKIRGTLLPWCRRARWCSQALAGRSTRGQLAIRRMKHHDAARARRGPSGVNDPSKKLQGKGCRVGTGHGRHVGSRAIQFGRHRVMSARTSQRSRAVEHMASGRPRLRTADTRKCAVHVSIRAGATDGYPERRWPSGRSSRSRQRTASGLHICAIRTVDRRRKAGVRCATKFPTREGHGYIRKNALGLVRRLGAARCRRRKNCCDESNEFRQRDEVSFHIVPRVTSQECFIDRTNVRTSKAWRAKSSR